MKPYALFLGCLIPYRLPYMEVAARKILDYFQIEVVESVDFGCCPEPIGVQGLDKLTWLCLAARNLCVAEEKDLDLLTLCNGCYETLKVANLMLRENEPLRKNINSLLSKVGKEFRGKTEVKHLVEALYKDVGVTQITKAVQKPLSGLRVATHYGCHMLRPSRYLKFDNPEQPTSLDELVAATGAKSVQYQMKMWCCGSGLGSIDPMTSLSIAKRKLSNVKRSGADCLTVICPYCMIQYDLNQPTIERTFGEHYDIPVFYYPELLCLAIGVKPEELGLKFHRVSTSRILQRANCLG